MKETGQKDSGFQGLLFCITIVNCNRDTQALHTGLPKLGGERLTFHLFLEQFACLTVYRNFLIFPVPKKVTFKKNQNKATKNSPVVGRGQCQRATLQKQNQLALPTAEAPQSRSADIWGQNTIPQWNILVSGCQAYNNFLELWKAPWPQAFHNWFLSAW